MSKAPVSRVSRTLLFVPADRPERFEKALASGADQIVLDLEDSVAPQEKDQARAAVSNWVSKGNPAIIRINAMNTDWYEDDISLVKSVPGAGVMLAKADVDSLTHASVSLPGRSIIGLLETVAGYMNLRPLAAIAGLERIAFGSVDFAGDSGITDSGDALTTIRTQIVLESRFANLTAPIDGVSVQIQDSDQVRADALRSRHLGFGGKLCIHPRQISPVREAFSPTPAELEWALRVLAAFEASNGAATAVDGKMIDRPVVDQARCIAGEASKA